MRNLLCFALVPCFCLAACSTDPVGPGDAGATDGGTDAGSDGGTDAGSDGGTDAGSDGGAGSGIAAAASVLQHHLHASRDGAYVVPGLTRAAAATLHLDSAFDGGVTGHVYAQPLYVDRGGSGDALIVATESNEVSALDAATGAPLARTTLGTPATIASHGCGNIDPLGITGTPLVDAPSNRLYLDALQLVSGSPRHFVYALSLADLSVQAKIDLDAAVAGFASLYQNQRGALALAGGSVFVPFGGHYGDCGTYHGWVVGVPLSGAAAYGWATRAPSGGAIWGPSGIASDGSSIFAVTGNTFDAATWQDGEGVFRFTPSAPLTPADSFTPSNWQALDNGDVDISGSGVQLLPGGRLIVLGKDGNAYVLGKGHLGGLGGQLAIAHVSSEEIIGAPAVLAYADGSALVVFRGAPAASFNCSGDLTALRVSAATPPVVSFAWCAAQHGLGSPIVTTTDGSSEALVWSAGAEGDSRLRAFDAATGAVVFDGGGAANTMGSLRRYSTPIAARGRLFVAGDGKVYAFKTN
jgi:hypothetical protein